MGLHPNSSGLSPRPQISSLAEREREDGGGDSSDLDAW